MATSSLRLYDEAILKHFSQIEISDGETIRNPQVTFATVGYYKDDVQATNNNRPLLPIIMIHRNGIAKNEATNMFKSRLTRPAYYQRTDDKKNFIGMEIIPYNFLYTIVTLSLTMEENAQLTEQMIWYLSRKPSVRMIYSAPHVQMEMPGYISEYNIVDNMSYDTLQNDTLRLFRMTYDLTLFAYLFYEKQNVHSVTQVKNTMILPDFNGELNPHLDDRFSVINKPNKKMWEFEEP